MQESAVDQRDAERVGPSWYLSRDGQQIGPLTDRELSQFAKGGNFRPGDLLWTAGLDGWKAADAVFGLKASAGAAVTKASAEPAVEPKQAADQSSSSQLSVPAEDATLEFVPSSSPGGLAAAEADVIAPDVIAPDVIEPGVIEPDVIAHDAIEHDVVEPDVIEPQGEDVVALVQALKGETEPPKLSSKERVVHELKAFAGAFAYLWVVFTVLLLHEWLVLSDHHVGFAFYGLATLNALGLGKIMIVAEHFRFAEHLREKPLIFPIVYKTLAFTTLLLGAYVLEMMLFGWIGGHGFLSSAPTPGGSLFGTLIVWLIFCVALMPYFAFKELERAVGPAMIRKLLLGRR